MLSRFLQSRLKVYKFMPNYSLRKNNIRISQLQLFTTTGANGDATISSKQRKLLQTKDSQMGMDNATYRKLRQTITKKFAPEKHVAFTKWIKSIQKASIVKLDRTQEFEDDATKIQVKRMGEDDLENDTEISLSGYHENEKFLDVVKLPMPIPVWRRYNAPDFLFIRPDEYELFKCFGKTDWCILTGNPGISKSWFQWKFILLCYRQDLYHLLWPRRTENVLGKMSSAKRRYTEESKVQEEESEVFIPQLIVRTMEGKEALLFFMKRPENVLYFKHSPEDIKQFTDRYSTILWEPGHREEPVYFSEVSARIIATVSPNEKRFHEFRKDAKMFYMPCPSELQLRLMGQIYRKFQTGYNVTDAEIHNRVLKYGPFIRIALSWSQDEIDEFERKREEEVEKVCATPTIMRQKLQSPMQIMITSNGLSGLSHRLARYDVQRDKNDEYSGFTRLQYRISSEEVPYLISLKTAQLGVERMKQHLRSVNNGEIRVQNAKFAHFEHLLKIYIIEGFKWMYHRMPLESITNGSENNNLEEWKVFSLKLKTVNEDKKTKYKDMKEGVLYFPSNPNFPFVDMYYIDPKTGALIGIQATFSQRHPKNESVFEKFYQAIDTSPEKTKLHLYYVILPSWKNTYRQKYFAESFVFKGSKAGISAKWKDNIEFNVLLPSDTFERNFPDDE